MNKTERKLRQLQKDIIYLDAAFNIAKLSKDENTQVGAKIIAADGSPVSEGRNGPSRNMPPRSVPLSREVKKLKSYGDHGDNIELESNKYPFMLHAEENAILFTQDRKTLEGATIYVTHMPCPMCANKISQVGIKRVVCPIGSVANMTGRKENDITKYIFHYSEIEYVEIKMDS